MQRKLSRMARISTASIAAVVVTGATFGGTALAARSGSYAGRLYYKGAAHTGSTVTFNVRRGKVRNFAVRGALSSCFSGFSGEAWEAPFEVNIPTIAIANNGIKAEHVVNDENGDKLSTSNVEGRFSGVRMSGKVHFLQDYPYCEALYDFKAARRG